jgi:PAS domain-containing protein
MDAAGNLLYYNEPAEEILGLRFDEAGEIHADHLADLFHASNPDGSPLANGELPVVKALVNRLPSHGRLRIRSHQGDWRHIEVTALPVVAAEEDLLGVIAIFWETPQ